MVIISKSYLGKKILVEVTQDILSFSLPNKNYLSIADTTFEHSILGLKNSNLSNFFENIDECLYLLIAHGNSNNYNQFEFYETRFKTKNLEEHLIQKREELNFNSALILACNMNKIEKFDFSFDFPIAIPQYKFEVYSYNKFLFFNL